MATTVNSQDSRQYSLLIINKNYSYRSSPNKTANITAQLIEYCHKGALSDTLCQNLDYQGQGQD